MAHVVFAHCLAHVWKPPVPWHLLRILRPRDTLWTGWQPVQSKTDLHGATPFTKEDWRLCLERAGIATCFHMPDEAAFFGDTEHGRSTAFSVMAVKKHTVGRAKPLPQRLLPGRTRPRDPGCRDGHWAFVATPGWAESKRSSAL